MATLKVVTGALTGFDGTQKKTGTVLVKPSQACTIPGTQELLPAVITATVSAVDGTWTVSLYSNADLTPTGTYYTVVEMSPDGGYQSMTIQVPQTAGPFVASSIMTSTPTVGASPNHVSTLTVDALTATEVVYADTAGLVATDASFTFNKVTKLLSATAATLTGALTAASAAITGAITAASATLTGAVTAGSARFALYPLIDPTHPNYGMDSSLADNGPALQLALNKVLSLGRGTIAFPAGLSAGSVFKYTTPVTYNGSFLSMRSLGALVTLDYQGAAGTVGITLGDPSWDTLGANAGGVTQQSVELRNLNLENSTLTAKSVLTCFRIQDLTLDHVTVNGATAANSKAVRLLGCDFRIDLNNVSIGSNPSEIPYIGLSIESGSNQVRLGNTGVIQGTFAAVVYYNSVGLFVKEGTYQVHPAVGGTAYIFLFRSDQAIPTWLTWLPGNAGGRIRLRDVICEPVQVVNSVIYDVYVGYGAPASGSTVVIDCEIENLITLAQAASGAVNDLVTLDYCDQAVVEKVRFDGNVRSIVHLTANALRPTVYLPQDNTGFDQGTVTNTILDDGCLYPTKIVKVGTQLQVQSPELLTAPHMTSPVVDSGGATITAGNLLMVAGDVDLQSATAAVRNTVGSLILDATAGNTIVASVGGVTSYRVVGASFRPRAQIFPSDEALAEQSTGGVLHSAGVPSNANGINNDWCISDNGHLYFKAAGAWVQKI